MYKVQHHLFWDNGDEFCEDKDLAVQKYEALGEQSKRLYIEEYATEEDYEDAAPTKEDCLLSNGAYPA